MNDINTEPTVVQPEPAPAAPRTLLDWRKDAVWLAVDQTPGKDYVEFFTGRAAEKKCRDYALERTKRLKRDVAVSRLAGVVGLPQAEPSFISRMEGADDAK